MCIHMYLHVHRAMGQKNSLHMVDPATWLPRPMQLHIACGKKIALSEEGSVAQRMDATKQHKDGLVHTAWPVAVGRLFQVTYVCVYSKCDCMTEKWRDWCLPSSVSQHSMEAYMSEGDMHINAS